MAKIADAAPPHPPRSPEFRGFFEHAAAGCLAFPCCRACGRHHWYPMPRCPSCLADDIGWKPVSGRGEIFSFTTIRHAFDKGRALPYVVALVTFPDAPGVRLVTNIVEAVPEALAIGQPVDPVFSIDGMGEAGVVFRPACAKRSVSPAR